MPISIKNTSVPSCQIPLFICHSHWSPCFERTTICNISVIICINACQQIFIHCDISCQNYVRLQILRGSVCQCSVYKPGKPVKLPCISDFVGFVTVRFFTIGIYIIFAGCKYCRLVCAADCTKSIFIYMWFKNRGIRIIISSSCDSCAFDTSFVFSYLIHLCAAQYRICLHIISGKCLSPDRFLTVSLQQICDLTAFKCLRGFSFSLLGCCIF